MKWLNRLATSANRAPLRDDERAFDRRVVIVGLIVCARSASAHRVERHALDTSSPKPWMPGDLTRVVGEQADLVQPEVGEHLRAQAELAQRRVRRRAAGGARRRWRRAQRLELARDVAARGDVDERAAPRRLDLRDGLAQVPPAVARRRGEDVGERRARCARGRAAARRPSSVALHEREELPVVDRRLVDDGPPLGARLVEA